MIALVCGLLVLAVAAAGAVVYFGPFDGEGASDGEPVQTRPEVYRTVDTGRMNEVLASREADNRPLNESELFERHNAEISSQDIDFTLRDSDLTEACESAVWGQQIADVLASAGCSQAARATYVSDDYFGVTAVFNLADTEGSRDLAAAMADPEDEPQAAAARGFVLPPSGEAPFDRLGQGYSAADAIVSGHYLVVVWVQPADSESVEERVSLAGPLVALANVRDPLYRRMVTLDEGTTGTGGAGTGEDAATDGTGLGQ